MDCLNGEEIYEKIFRNFCGVGAVSVYVCLRRIYCNVQRRWNSDGMERVLTSMKKSSKKSERLTAAQARAIPIDESAIQDGLQSVYKAIREAAGQGRAEIVWRPGAFSDGIRAIIKQRLEDDGYYVTDTRSYFVWRINWKE